MSSLGSVAVIAPPNSSLVEAMAAEPVRWL